MRKRSFDRDFKLMLVRQLISGEKRLSVMCREHSLHENVVRRWRAQYESEGESAWLVPADELPQMNDSLADAKARNSQLEAALGRAHLEIEFLRLALEKKGSNPRTKSP